MSARMVFYAVHLFWRYEAGGLAPMLTGSVLSREPD